MYLNVLETLLWIITQLYVVMTKYQIEGVQKIVKIVRSQSGQTGRVYVPKEWIGEEVEIVRTGVKVE
jgi:putative transposon-encoded protein